MDVNDDTYREVASMKYRFFEPISVVQKDGAEVSLRYYLFDNHIPLARVEAKDDFHHAMMVMLPEDLVLKRSCLIYVGGIDDPLMKQNLCVKQGTCLLCNNDAKYDYDQTFDICNLADFARNYQFFPDESVDPGLSDALAKIREK